MEEWIDKMNYRSTLSAKQLFQTESTLKCETRCEALWALFKKLIISGGIFQGKNGF